MQVSAAVAGAIAVGVLALPSAAGADTGGVGPGGTSPPPSAPPPTPTGPAGQATLLSDGSALAPSDAPPQVVEAIAAANQIRTFPYIWGGGHASFTAMGYDCSGAVSYMLHGAGLLESPLPSGPLMRYGTPGLGNWITVYANRSHTYAVVAGLRWDTSAGGDKLKQGSGPRWRQTMLSGGAATISRVKGKGKKRPRRVVSRYIARHYPGL